MENKNIRYRISELVDDLTKDFIDKSRVIFNINGKSYCASLFFKRFTLTFIEKLFIDALKMYSKPIRNGVDPATTVSITTSKGKNHRDRGRLWQMAEAIGGLLTVIGMRIKFSKIITLFRRGLNKLIYKRICYIAHIFFNRPSFTGVRRIFIVDGGEIKRSILNGRRYVYHKYLEGIIDIDRMDIPEGDIIVLYGDYENIGIKRLLDPRIVVLDKYFNKAIKKDIHKKYALVHEVMSEFYDKIVMSEIVSMFERKKTTILKSIVCRFIDKTEVYSDELVQPVSIIKGSIDKSIIGKYASENYFKFLLLNDLQIVASTECLLTKIGNRSDVDIYLDNFDSTLFTLSQFLINNYPYRIVALQKVLGPYIFSFNINKNRHAFKEPSKILTWAEFHTRMLKRLGYGCEFESKQLYKFRVYEKYKRMDTSRARRILKIPSGKKVVMFSAVKEVLGYTLIYSSQYVHMLSALAEMVEKDDDIFVVFKPWPGENVDKIKKYVLPLFPENSYKIVDDRLARKVHNVELLNIADVLISTMSSFIGEAIFFGTIPVLINYGPCEQYFTTEYTDEFRKMTVEVNELIDFKETLSNVLNYSPEERRKFFDSIEPAFRYVFGEASIDKA